MADDIVPPAVAAPAAVAPTEPRDIRDRLSSLTAELERAKTDAATAVATATAWQSKHTELQARHVQDIAMVKAGGQFGHTAVQRVVRTEYGEYVNEGGKDAFDAWLPAQKAHPVIGRFYDAPATAAAVSPGETVAAKPAPLPPPASPNAGAREPQAGAPSSPTDDEIRMAIRNAPRGPGARLPAAISGRK